MMRWALFWFFLRCLPACLPGRLPAFPHACLQLNKARREHADIQKQQAKERLRYFYKGKKLLKDMSFLMCVMQANFPPRQLDTCV